MGSDRSHVGRNRGGELRDIYQFVGLNTRHPPGAQHQEKGNTSCQNTPSRSPPRKFKRRDRLLHIGGVDVAGHCTEVSTTALSWHGDRGETWPGMSQTNGAGCHNGYPGDP